MEHGRIKGMIFAAGLGTRLYPLTKDRPKALVEVNGKTLLQQAIEKLVAAGITEIVVNVHHFSELMKDYLQSRTFGATIRVSDESEVLLDTAGGLKFAEPLLQDADHILLHNVDILSDIDINSLITSHIQSDALATLAVRSRETARYFVFDKATMRLCGWQNIKTGEVKQSLPTDKPNLLAFSGIHVVKRELLHHIPANRKLSMTPVYLDLAKEHRIMGFLHQDGSWRDVGKFEELRIEN